MLSGCPSDRESVIQKSDLERLQKNNMDLPDQRSHYFHGINYKLSNLFQTTYYQDFVLSDVHEIKTIASLNLYFSIESFNKSKAEAIRFKFDDENLSLLDAVHDHYAIQRNSTLKDATVSIKKEVPKSVGFPGVMQTISGATYKGVQGNTYFFATIDLKEKIIVVQLIGKEENMGYLYDDFIEIISSISI